MHVVVNGVRLFFGRLLAAWRGAEITTWALCVHPTARLDWPATPRRPRTHVLGLLEEATGQWQSAPTWHGAQFGTVTYLRMRRAPGTNSCVRPDVPCVVPNRTIGRNLYQVRSLLRGGIGAVECDPHGRRLGR